MMNNILGETYLYCNKNPTDILIIYSSSLLLTTLSVFNFDSFVNNTNHIYNKLTNIPEVILDFFFEEEDNYLKVSNDYDYPLEQDTTDIIGFVKEEQDDTNIIKELLEDMELSDKCNNLCLPEHLTSVVNENNYLKDELLSSESFNLKDWNKLENRSDSYYKTNEKENNKWASLFKF